MIPLALILAFAAIPGAHAGTYGLAISHAGPMAVEACSALISSHATYFSEYDPVGFCDVQNQPALASMAKCLKQVRNRHAQKIFETQCGEFGMTSDILEKALVNGTQFFVDGMSLEPSELPSAGFFQSPVEFPNAVVAAAFQSEKGNGYNINKSTWLGTALVAYWFVAVLASGAANLFGSMFPKVVRGMNGSFSNGVRKHLFLAPLGKIKHAQHVTAGPLVLIMAPLRMETILIAGWIILAAIFAGVGISHDPDNVIYPLKRAEIGRKTADRAGILAVFIMPVVILFGGRNNFLQWVLGWPFGRFLVVHRWMARILFLLGVVHSVAMTFYLNATDQYKYLLQYGFMPWGMVALAAGGLTMIQGLGALRRKHYELFLGFHLLLAALFVAGVWRHTADIYVNYVQWLHAAVAIWVFDRVVRLARLAAFGVQKAEVKLIANETLKVTVPRPSYWYAYPGAHAFVHFLRPSCFWQSHPFTVVDLHVEKNTVVFYLKVKGGLTHGLYQYLLRQPGQCTTIKVLVEGPYGLRIPLRHCGSLVLIAGGTGIPGLYSEALDLVRNADSLRVRLHWIVRHYKSVEWFYEELRHLQNTSVEVVLHVTQAHLGLETPVAPEKPELAEKGDCDHISALRKLLPHVTFCEGRPDIDAIVQKEIAESEDCVGFVTCAHGQVVDMTRNAVRNHLEVGKRVELFEKLQMW